MKTKLQNEGIHNSTITQRFHFPPFTDFHCDTGTAYGLDALCCHKMKELVSMTMSWMVSRVPCTCRTLVHTTWKPQHRGWYMAWAWAMKTDPYSPQLQIISNLFFF